MVDGQDGAGVREPYQVLREPVQPLLHTGGGRLCNGATRLLAVFN